MSEFTYQLALRTFRGGQLKKTTLYENTCQMCTYNSSSGLIAFEHLHKIYKLYRKEFHTVLSISSSPLIISSIGTFLRALEEKEDVEEEHPLLNYTMRINEGAQRGSYKCNECGKVSISKKDSLRHIEAVHYPGTYQYPCDHCDDVLDSKSKFWTHMRKHGKKARK